MSSSNRNAVISFVVVLMTGLIVAGAVVLKPDANANTSSQTASTSTSRSSSSSTSTTDQNTPNTNSSSSYKDGTYSTTVGYDTPEGTESMGVSITVKNDTISDTSVTQKARSRESRAYQQDFIASYASFVKGKKLANLQLGIVAGASLTSAGFNDALGTLRSQAQS